MPMKHVSLKSFTKLSEYLTDWLVVSNLVTLSQLTAAVRKLEHIRHIQIFYHKVM